MFPIGMLPEELARQFVVEHPLAQLGSMSRDGRRRIFTEASGEVLQELQIAFSGVALRRLWRMLARLKNVAPRVRSGPSATGWRKSSKAIGRMRHRARNVSMRSNA